MRMKFALPTIGLMTFLSLPVLASGDYSVGYATLSDEAGRNWNGISVTGLMHEGPPADFIMTTSLMFGGDNSDSMLWTFNSGPSFPVTDNFALYVLGGISYLDSDTVDYSGSDFGFNLGGGARFYLNKRLLFNVGVEKSLVSNRFVSNPTSFNFGVGWLF